MDRRHPGPVRLFRFGETPEEALREALIAKEAWLEAARVLGKPIPEPRYRPG